MKTSVHKGEMVTPPIQDKRSGLKSFLSFIGYVLQRFQHDRMQQRAASLTFTSLLAIVPLLAISFAIFAAFPAFESLKGQAQDFIFDNFVPQVGSAVQEHLESFTAKAQGGLSTVGIAFLAVTSIMLLVTISATFNDIWRVRQPRAFLARLLVYWAILTLGPLFFGANISISSALFAYAQTSGLESITGPLVRFLGLLPFFLQSFGFAIMFLLIPNFSVRKRDAIMGGFVAGILLEALKKLFGLYVVSFPTYETIYGAMATIPIFLIWVYLSWIVVLLSAEFTAALPEWRAGSRTVMRDNMSLTERLAAVLSVLYTLKCALTTGQGLTERQLPAQTRLGPEMLTYAVTKLEDLSYITKTETGRWHLCRDLKGLNLGQLAENLGLTLTPDLANLHLRDAWGHRLQNHLGRSKAETLEALNQDLPDILAKTKANENYSLADDIDRADDEVNAPSNKQFLGRILTLIGLGTAGN